MTDIFLFNSILYQIDSQTWLHIKFPKNLFAEFLFAKKYRLTFAKILFAKIFICGIFICQIAATQFGLIYNTGTDVMIFENIFAQNFGKKIGVLDSKQRKTQIFLPKFFGKNRRKL
jgi:hypothetical protein